MQQQNISFVDAGVIPTPLLFWWAREKGADVALMISASHNPFHDNGIKIFDVKSGKISEADERYISDRYNSLAEEPVGSLDKHPVDMQPAYDWQLEYQSWVKSALDSRLHCNKKVVLDLSYGAMSTIAEAVFRLFVDEVIVLHDKPNGRNINDAAGALYPEKLVQKVLEEEAEIGFAFDGDGDRVIVVDKNGIIRDGDDMLFLLLKHPFFADQAGIVGTVMSNGGFQEALKERAVQLIRTPVGDKYVAAAMEQHQLLLGGEPSGHLIIKPYTSTGDGLFVALKILETMIVYQCSFEQTFARFVQISTTLPVPVRIPFEELSCFTSLQALHKEIAPGRMIVRYSGTEPVVRITTEHFDQGIAQTIQHQIRLLLEQAY